jgi:hypothetical protein
MSYKCWFLVFNSTQKHHSNMEFGERTSRLSGIRTHNFSGDMVVRGIDRQVSQTKDYKFDMCC